jgi:DNA-binding transcriptional ArsR family regulator
MSLLPSSPDVAPDGEPRVVGLDSEEADDLMAALSSTTARELLAELHEEPAPPGELADRVGTSLQNAQYHLENLGEAGAVEVVGTAYSEKGREMRVYGPADSPLVIFAGEKERASGLRAALSRLFGGFAALALGSLAVQGAFGRSLLADGDEAVPAGETATPPETSEGGAAGGGHAGDESGPGTYNAEETTTETQIDDGSGTSGGTETPQQAPTETADGVEPVSGSPTETASGGDAAAEPSATGSFDTATETATETAAGATPTPSGDEFDFLEVFEVAFGSGLPPGLAFFLGGATVLTLVVATTYVQARP